MNSFSLSLDWDSGKKLPNVQTMHCYPLEPGTLVFCENPSVHSSKRMANSPQLQEEETLLRTKQQPTWPCPVLVMNKWRHVPAPVKGQGDAFPSSVLGGCSSALQVPNQAYKYCWVSQGRARKHRHIAAAKCKATQHKSNRKDFRRFHLF